MISKIITVANQKGGAGKTTVSMQLAGAFGKKDIKVLVVDADPQATATRWATSAEDENPFPATVVGLSAAGGKIHREIKKFINDYQVIIIDCPPAVDSPVPQSALMISDLVLVPIIPSPLDIWATVGIKKMIENIQDVNESLDARLVINQCQPNTNLARDVIEILADFGINMTDNQLHQRVVFRQSPAIGGTVHDFGKKANQAIEEVEGLADEVMDILFPK